MSERPGSSWFPVGFAKGETIMPNSPPNGQNAVVLMTGTTGFIGGATLAGLLETHPDCRMLLLTREQMLDDE